MDVFSKCRDCGNEFGDQLDICPICGSQLLEITEIVASNGRSTTKYYWFYWLITSSVVFGLFMPTIPIFPLVIAGVFFPVKIYFDSKSILTSFFGGGYVLLSVLLGYIVFPTIFGVKSIMLVADYVTFPGYMLELVGVALFIAFVPFFITLVLILLFRTIRH